MLPIATVRMPSALPLTQSPTNFFDILEDEQLVEDKARLASVRNRSTSTWNPFAELSIDHYQNRAVLRDPSSEDSLCNFAIAQSANSLDAKFVKSPVNSRVPRRRRPPVGCETFEPLDSVEEEASGFAGSESSAVRSTSPKDTTWLRRLPQDNHLENHPLVSAEPNCPRQQVANHLAGQFEWIISYPATVSSIEHHGSLDKENSGPAKGHMVYGCNLLSRKRRSPSKKANSGCPLANTYTLIATQISGNACSPEAELSTTAIIDQIDQIEMSLVQSPMSQGTPLKVPGMKVSEQAVSPSLSAMSERSSFFLEALSPSGSFSVPRIEDSLEEIDKLEDQLEAVGAVTGSRGVGPADSKPNNAHQTPSDAKRSTAAKRASIAGQFATVRVKPSERTRPTIRRSASMTLHEQKRAVPEMVPEQKAHASLSRSKPTIRSLDAPKPPAKSAKPPTVPNFELPGEAVSRRLKEQREARQQRADGQTAYVAPPRPKSSKPLTKSTFELPGEAISRRKREEREAKLKAQEEEERKRREFKARPIRQSIGPSTLPRETITSRARQAKAQDGGAQLDEMSRSRRSIAGLSRPPINTSMPGSSAHVRGRNSTNISVDETSRATSESVGSTSGKRSTLSAEEAVLLRHRGRDVIKRDNSFSQDRERERRDRETNAKTAREEAAERSRAASREWAEKKRRKELAMRASMREAMEPKGEW